MTMKKFRCLVRLADGWQTETFVFALDHNTATKLAEAQTGGKCLAAFQVD